MMESRMLGNLEIELEQEDDGRWIAEAINLPGVMVYGESEEEAISRVQMLAERVIADQAEHSEIRSEPTRAQRQSEIRSEPTRAQRQMVSLFEGLELDGYRMPDGEFRLSTRGASKALGYSEPRLMQLLSGKGNSVKGLAGLNPMEEIQRVVIRIEPGGREIATISLYDFMQLVSYAVFNGNKAALALQLSLIKASLNDFFEDAFNRSPSSIDEKRRTVYETYAETISPKKWKRMRREEILHLALSDNETA